MLIKNAKSVWQESDYSRLPCRGYTQWKYSVRESIKQPGIINWEKYIYKIDKIRKVLQLL